MLYRSYFLQFDWVKQNPGALYTKIILLKSCGCDHSMCMIKLLFRQLILWI